jgi:hypothetical protein
MAVEQFVDHWEAQNDVVKYRWGWNNNHGARRFWKDFFREVYDIDFENDDRIKIVENEETVQRTEKRFLIFRSTYSMKIQTFEFEFNGLSVGMDYRPERRDDPDTGCDLSCSFQTFVHRRGVIERIAAVLSVRAPKSTRTPGTSTTRSRRSARSRGSRRR